MRGLPMNYKSLFTEYYCAQWSDKIEKLNMLNKQDKLSEDIT